MPLTTVVNIKTSKCDVYIGRPSVYGNPFKIGYDYKTKTTLTRDDVIRKYKKWLYKPEQSKLRKQAIRELPGKSLGCFCKPLACHGDVLADLVNSSVDN